MRFSDTPVFLVTIYLTSGWSLLFMALGCLSDFFFLNETFPGIKYYLFFAENDTVWADIARFACVITFYGHIIIYNSFIILSCQPGIHFIFLRWLRMFLWDSLNFNFKVCFSNDISNYFRGKNRCFNVSPYRRTILMYLSLLWPWMYLYG